MTWLKFTECKPGHLFFLDIESLPSRGCFSPKRRVALQRTLVLLSPLRRARGLNAKSFSVQFTSVSPEIESKPAVALGPCCEVVLVEIRAVVQRPVCRLGLLGEKNTKTKLKQ